jgi:hypothetical protein
MPTKYEKRTVEARPIKIAVEKYLEKHEMTLSDFARVLGWNERMIKGKIKPDITRVHRCLDKQTMQITTAEKIIAIIGRDPHEFDI